MKIALADTFSLWSRPVPLASFTAVMGIVGTALDMRGAHALGFGFGAREIGDCAVAIGIGVFVILALRWLLRLRSHPNELAAESSAAGTANFYGAIGISCSLTAAAIAPDCVSGAFALWIIAAAGGAILMLYLLGKWIQDGLADSELMPAMFLPAVGNAASVYVAAQIGVQQFAWFSFSLALISWMVLLPLSLYRLIVTKPRLPRRLAPQIAIYVSAPAVLANAWFVLDGGRADDLFTLLACASLFFALLTLRLWRLAWGEPFNVAMWGWTFPAAALAGSFERIAIVNPSSLPTTFALALLWLAIGITAGCMTAAVWGWMRQLSLALHWSHS